MNPKAGLAFWAQRALEELDKANQNFDADPVHDLRVALRRCRSMADGFLSIDPDPGWKQLKKLGKELFRRLGNLRDMQVMEEWVQQLAEAEDPVRKDLLQLFSSQEQPLKQDAQTALHAFDRKHWQALAQRLAKRSRKIPAESVVFQHIALERWEQARHLHHRALRNRSQAAFHQLRIGLKKFRYTVENFLPQRHEKWGADLKELQDLLGEIHDLDVVGAVLRTRDIAPEDRTRWQAKIRNARQQRLGRYREKMLGRKSLWHVWRSGLPQGEHLQDAALARLRTWGAFLDPDVAHSRHVSRLALQIYDGLTRDGVVRATDQGRRILQTAALLHDVGKAKGKRGHHKESARLIRKQTPPLGWTAQELRAVAAVARYHCGALPRPEHKCLKGLPSSMRRSVNRLAGVLRLANALDLSHARKVRRLELESQDGLVVVRGAGYAATGTAAERVAAARYLLESSCNRAVLVRPI